MKSIVLRDGILLTMDSEDITPFVGSVVIEDNRIACLTQDSIIVENYLLENPLSRVIDCRGKVIMPGLINTHCHVPMTLQRGLADDIELMEWLREWVWPFEAHQSEDDIEVGAALGVAEMLLGGVTTFYDMYFSEHRVARAVEKMGGRALLAECVFDNNASGLDDNLSKLLEVTSRSSRVRAAIAPHAPYTCSRELIERCDKLSRKYSLPLTCHLLESPSEREMVLSSAGCQPLEHLASGGVVRAEMLLVHSIQLDESDMQHIKDSGASISHNPQSNMKISSGVAPIAKLLEMGINVTLGTDGPCSNNDLDMWEEMRSAAMLQRVVTMNPLTLPAVEVLRMVTVNGAKAIGMEGELGIIRSGALADLIVIDMNKAHLQPLHNVVSTLLYCVKASDVEITIVDGDIVVEGGELKGVDIEGLMSDVNRRANRILSELGK